MLTVILLFLLMGEGGGGVMSGVPGPVWELCDPLVGAFAGFFSFRRR